MSFYIWSGANVNIDNIWYLEQLINQKCFTDLV